MRVFGCVYMLLGLSLCVFRAWCNRVCKTPFNDTASSAYLADVVLEGDVIVTLDPLDSSLENYNVTIKVLSRKKIFKIIKDTSGSVKSVLDKYKGKITVGLFGPENLDACVTQIVKDSRYIFFLRTTTSPDYFRISAFPISTPGKKVRRKIGKQLKSILCKDCAKEPKINKRLKDTTVQEKKKVKLRCSASGNPRPIITWMRKGKVLRKSKRMRIKSGRKGSRLEIKRPSRRAAGEYTCVAENVVKRVEKVVTLTVNSPPKVTPSRFIPCNISLNGYCLNGGNCTYSPELKEKFCKCLKEYSGKRCEYLDIFTVFGPIETKARLDRDRTLIVIGIVIACLVFIIICIASYYLAKQKRVNFYKRREEKRNRNSMLESYKPLLRDEVDCGVPKPVVFKISMTTQTDESVFLMLENGSHTEDDRPDSPRIRAVGNHVFRYFPNSSPVREHATDHPANESSNAQPQRQRLQAVSVDAETLQALPDDGRDTPDTAQDFNFNVEEGAPPPLKSNVSSDSCDSLPFAPPIPDTTSPDSQALTADDIIDNADSSPSQHSSAKDMPGDDTSSESEAEEDLTIKHPELMVHLYISEEDLSDKGSQKLPAESSENQTEEPMCDPGQPESETSNLESPTVEPFTGDLKCNGYEDIQGQNLYDEEEESTSEDSSNSNSSSSSESSLVGTEAMPSIMALENHHVKDPEREPGNLSWDEHGTPVITQYACNPYALEMEEDIVNSQDLYQHDPTSNFRQFEPIADRAVPPPVGDKLKDLEEDQDAVLL